MSPRNTPSSIFRFFFNESTVLAVIALNALAVFFGAFPEIPQPWHFILQSVDYACLIYFVVELIAKVAAFGFPQYWKNLWNRLDFFIVLVSLPLLAQPPWVEYTLGFLAIAPLLRLGRFLRFVRVMKVIPNSSHIWRGSARALRASVGVFFCLLTLNLVLALGANMLFGKTLEEFENPLIASYTLFKVFTVEGWFEIPDKLAANPNADAMDVIALRLYMVFSVLIGGILGLSLANAVFVDEMVNDNTEELERQVAELSEEIRSLREEVRAALKR